SADACPSTPPGASVNPSGCTAGECYGPPSGMVGWWTGDGHAADVQGPTHENGATLNGAGFAAGKVGQSFSLDGIDDRVEIPDSPAVSPTGAITVDAWVMPDSITQPTAFVAKYDSSTSQISYFFGTNQGGKLEFYVSQSGTDSLARYALTDAEVITPGVFSHVAATFDPQTQAIRIFVNGQEVASSLVLSGTVTSVFDGTQPLYLGAYKNGAGVITGHFDGLMDEVELFNRALTPHEIKAIYDAGAAGKCKPPTADLSLTKSPSRSPAVVTRILTYTLAVKNWGPSPAQSVVVTDNLPTNAAYVSTITPVGTCARSGSTVTCQLGDMAPGQTVNVEVRVRPNQPATLTNTASVASQTFDPVSSNNSHTVQTQAVIAADLSIKKVASKDPSLVNQIFNYKLTVTNDGPATATGAVVTDNLPSGPTFMSAEPSQGTCSHAAGVVTCQLGSVASGAAATVIVRIRPRQAGTLVNTASVAGAEHDQDTSNNSATVTTSAIQSADLSVSKTESADPVLVGSQVTYTVKVTNNGFVAATGVTMTDTLPAGLGFVSAATSQGSVTSAPPAGSSGQVVVALGNISVGATATVTITVTANEPGAFTDSATAAGNEADHEPGNNTKKQTTTVVTLQKLLLSASTVVGGCQPYPTGTVYLTGPAPAGGVTVSLSSTNAGASPQTTVFIPAGALKSAAFAVPTSPVLSVQSGSVRATLGAKTIGRSLTVTPGVCN
ncbi:MAG TPA: LamG-like jellyroll fold domain-containing protein, partial [Pyrinomonadaceae bacterium]|nr:LamG-like jellyroll fold domain-containing protein [Pyrinomonadaceae bacterium]